MKAKVDFETVLNKCEKKVRDLGLEIRYTHNLDSFYKGDIDGKRIFIGDHLSANEKLFNLLHLAGHSIQWNIDSLLRDLGSKLYRNPDDKLLKKLQTYEWQANCYAVTILHEIVNSKLDEWLTKKYVLDMMYLTHFYKTGKKLKSITRIAKAYRFEKKLKAIPIPDFTATATPSTRNGLVISFD